MRTLTDILNQLPVTAETGLSPERVADSRQCFGANRLTPLPRRPLWQKFLEKFDEPIIKILIAAALLSMAVDLFKASPVLGGLAGGLVVLLLAGAVILRKLHLLPSLMFAAALVIFFLGLGTGHVLVEGMAVMVAVILATGVAFVSEYKSDREFEVLNARKESLQAKVLRSGQFQTVSLEEVVVGDVVTLEMGDEIPADGRLLKATELYIDQSLMTGESEPARKSVGLPDDAAEGTEQPGCLYRGTQVVDGVGLMLVTEVGDATALGQIARRLTVEDGGDESSPAQEERVQRKLTISKELTPLQHKLARLAGLISKVGYLAAVLIFLAQLVRGIGVGEIYWPGTRHDFGQDVLQVFAELLGYFVTMVIIIVVAVPEGLPMSVTVSLALAMRKMTRAHSLVRQLVACETIGSATVICTDKTGTLTQNQMRVDRLGWDGRVFERGHDDWPRPKPFTTHHSPLTTHHSPLTTHHSPKPLDWFILNAAVNATAHLEEKQGRLVTAGNSTEGALLHWLREAGLEYLNLRLQFEPLYQVHFSSERKHMTTVIRLGERLLALVKGSPEWVMAQSSHYQAADGSVREWTEEARRRIQECLHDSAASAMRTLAFAFAWLPPETSQEREALHALREDLARGLVFAGFVAIRDPLRDDVKDALARCRQAGIDVKMVTGDSLETARAIAFEIGLIDRRDAPLNQPGSGILSSDRFNQLNDEELKKELPELRVLARSKPLDKYRLVRLLQELGEVVAVTGDGTNDAPALKKADVGLAMGIAGTEVAKEASKIVLLDDAFSTIVKAVHWGRSLYENIQRFLQFQLTINVSALAITFLGILLFNVKAPFTVLQLLWINVIMDTLASIALCSEPPRPGVMKVPPRRRDENILTPAMIRTIFTTAGFFLAVMLALLVGMKGEPGAPGWFAGPGPWAVEAAGTRLAVGKDQLEFQEGSWRIKEDARTVEPSLRGQRLALSFTVLQVSLFFSIYVFFQVWNQINCRSLTPETSGLNRLERNPVFLAVAGLVAVGQILIVTLGGTVFKVEPMGVYAWLGVAGFTSTVLIFAEAVRWLQRGMKKS